MIGRGVGMGPQSSVQPGSGVGDTLAVGRGVGMGPQSPAQGVAVGVAVGGIVSPDAGTPGRATSTAQSTITTATAANIRGRMLVPFANVCFSAYHNYRCGCLTICRHVSAGQGVNNGSNNRFGVSECRIL